MSRSDEMMHDVKQVPFNSILVDAELNSRTKLKDIKELAESIKEKGLLSPLLVTNGGSDKHPYTLMAGFRRAAALKELGWGTKPVNVIVVDDVDVNLIENVQRNDLHPFDMAQRIRDMVAGEYPVPPGKEAKKWDKKELAGALGLSVVSLNNYIRVLDGIAGEVRRKLKSQDVPFRFLLQLAGMTKKEKDEDGKTVEVPDDKAQLAAANQWIAEQEKLVASGRKKKPRGSSESEGGGSGKPKPSAVKEAIAIYDWQISAGKVKGAERDIVEARLDALRFVSGDLKKAPGITADIRKEYEADTAPVEEEETEEDGGEE